MIKKFVHAFMALALAIGVGLSATAPAEAGRGGRTAAIVGGTIIGLGVLGAYAHARDRAYYRGDGCYKGPLRCERVGKRCFYNRYGDYVCRGGTERCYRPTYCD
jgi:hypothetical protein